MLQDGNMKKMAQTVFLESLEAVSPDKLIIDRVSFDGKVLAVDGVDISLSDYRSVSVVAVGKAAVSMVIGLEQVLGDYIDRGFVLSNLFSLALPQKYRCYLCSHPLPSEDNVIATAEVVDALKNTDDEELIIFLISGGGSAMLCSPAEGVQLSEIITKTDRLIRSGEAIGVINRSRKELSNVKGGKLAKIAAPAKMVSLLISDVPGDDMSDIASGPTVTADIELANNVLIGGNIDMLRVMKVQLEKQNYVVDLALDQFTSSTREWGAMLAEVAKEKHLKAKMEGKSQAFIAGGETTVSVTGSGKGGRNCEVALAAALGIEGLTGVVILAAGTDGIDGPTDAAGAIAASDSIDRYPGTKQDAEKLLMENDSYNFFSKVDDLIMTGPTGTNLMDVVIVLAKYHQEVKDEKNS